MATLNERILEAGPRRIAFVGLAAKSGKTTAMRHVIAGLAEQNAPFGIASAGVRDSDLEAAGGPASLVLRLPESATVATTAPVLTRSRALLETVERVDCATSVGHVLVCRVVQAGEVEVIGPGTGADLRRVVEAIQHHTRGPVLIEGSIERKAFCAPGVAEALVMSVGAGLAPSVERVIPAVRYYLHLFNSPLVPPAATGLMDRAQSESRCLLVGEDWRVVDSFHWQMRDNAPSFLGRRDMGRLRAFIPQILTDDLVVPLLRERLRFDFVVRDPMRNGLSPIYHAAWEKNGGTIAVTCRPAVLAVTVNPINPTGPDFEPEELRDALAEGLSGVTVHDVIAEMQAAAPKKRWFGWPTAKTQKSSAD